MNLQLFHALCSILVLIVIDAAASVSGANVHSPKPGLLGGRTRDNSGKSKGGSLLANTAFQYGDENDATLDFSSMFSDEERKRKERLAREAAAKLRVPMWKRMPVVGLLNRLKPAADRNEKNRSAQYRP